MPNPSLTIIICSTRPGRVGSSVGDWFRGLAEGDGRFDVTVVDLKELDLPMLDEPSHPMRRDYQHEHTKAWSATVSASDAFVFVMPEYNHSFNAALKNAIDYLHEEWAHKPAAFVSYGGVSGGTRAVQALKGPLNYLKMVTVSEAVAIPFVASHLDDDGAFQGSDGLDGSARAMLDALLWWTDLLVAARA